jgi:hypothetical protein
VDAGRRGHATSTIITPFPLEWMGRRMSINLLNFTHPRDKQAACPTPSRRILIIGTDYRVTLSNSCLQQWDDVPSYTQQRTILNSSWWTGATAVQSVQLQQRVWRPVFEQNSQLIMILLCSVKDKR